MKLFLQYLANIVPMHTGRLGQSFAYTPTAMSDVENI